MTTKQVDPRNLRDHPMNARVYAGETDAENELLKESMTRLGQLEPIKLAADGEMVVSGCRRRQAAIALGWPLVEVESTTLSDPWEIEEAIIHHNRYRSKTTQQRAAEITELARIDAKRLAPRKTGHALPDGVEKERTVENVAKKLGVSKRSVRRAVKVDKHIESLRTAGDVEEAEKQEAIRRAVGVDPIYDEITKANKRLQVPNLDEVTIEPLTPMGREEMQEAIVTLTHGPKDLCNEIHDHVMAIREAIEKWPVTPAAPKDKRGVAVPRSLVPAFCCSLWTVGPALLTKAIKIAKQASSKSTGSFLELDRLLEHCEEAQRAITDAIPAVICPECKGKGCEWCRKGGHMPAWVFNDWKAKQKKEKGKS